MGFLKQMNSRKAFAQKKAFAPAFEFPLFVPDARSVDDDSQISMSSTLSAPGGLCRFPLKSSRVS